MGDYNTFLDEVAEELSHLAFSPAVAPPPTKISVIIPAYNTETYIAQCLLSLVKQTFREIEILVVDDGSTDNTRSIVKTFMQHDKRIKLITQENQGAGIAMCKLYNREFLIKNNIYFQDTKTGEDQYTYIRRILWQLDHQSFHVQRNQL